jgi:pimeloyl-ACP methyl ester carboxylesterase
MTAPKMYIPLGANRRKSARRRLPVSGLAQAFAPADRPSVLVALMPSARWLAVLVCALTGSCCLRGPTRPAGYYEVSIERGHYRTTTGERVRYALFIPEPDAELPPPPWPAVVLTHGFARDHTRHRNNALYLAERGVVVLTPDMGNLLGGERAQLQNIADLVGEVAWLAERSVTPGDTLSGLLDPVRIGLAGHSAGGAVSFEAAIDSQNAATPVAALCLLDGVPWERTIARAAEFPELAFASWRSEPSPCNADGEVRLLLNGLPLATGDVLIVGGTHCDPENPSDAACGLGCGCNTPERQLLYQQFLYLFVRESLQSPPVPSEPATYAAALDEAAALGLIVREPAGPAEGGG